MRHLQINLLCCSFPQRRPHMADRETTLKCSAVDVANRWDQTDSTWTLMELRFCVLYGCSLKIISLLTAAQTSLNSDASPIFPSIITDSSVLPLIHFTDSIELSRSPSFRFGIIDVTSAALLRTIYLPLYPSYRDMLLYHNWCLMSYSKPCTIFTASRTANDWLMIDRLIVATAQLYLSSFRPDFLTRLKFIIISAERVLDLDEVELDWSCFSGTRSGRCRGT